MKLCPKCGCEKDTALFYKSRGRPASWCKSCHNAATAAWCLAHPERVRERARNGMAKIRFLSPERLRANNRRWWRSAGETRPAEQLIAKRAIRAAVVRGDIIRPDRCSQCGVECKPDAHHPDYSKPLAVIWLCKPCHGVTWRIENLTDG